MIGLIGWLIRSKPPDAASPRSAPPPAPYERTVYAVGTGAATPAARRHGELLGNVRGCALHRTGGHPWGQGHAYRRWLPHDSRWM